MAFVVLAIGVHPVPTVRKSHDCSQRCRVGALRWGGVMGRGHSAGPAGKVSRERLCGSHVACNDVQPLGVRHYQFGVDPRGRPVVSNRLDWGNGLAMVSELRSPVCSSISLLLTGGVRFQQRLGSGICVCARVAKEVVFMRHARLARKHNRVIWGGVAIAAVSHELPNLTLRAEVSRRRQWADL
ncbi:unannotated protein [freshwater metagenome]|uniref:Unannotated protein n=1 Tax=freshwater metagenome TaxID=449393 RepID=A0A6J7H4H2_9ZZZZ